jgi:hypothetical protein
MTTFPALVVLLLRSELAAAHGALLAPTTRRGGTQYENDPVQSNVAEAFVCRHAARNAAVPLHQLTAGGTMQLTWNFGAAHVGDCAVFVSYDVLLARSAQRYFKVANLPKCREQNNQPMSFTLPTWLPGGEAIVRWDWYALHVFPSVEFYCVRR